MHTVSDVVVEGGFVYTTSGVYIPCANMASTYPHSLSSISMKRSTPGRSRGPRPKPAPTRRLPLRPIENAPSCSSARSDDEDDIHARITTFHHWGVDIAIDVACLGALDEQLFHAPCDAFADVCWNHAVTDEHHSVIEDDEDDDRTLEGSSVRTLDVDAHNTGAVKEEFRWSQDIKFRSYDDEDDLLEDDETSHTQYARPLVLTKAIASPKTTSFVPGPTTPSSPSKPNALTTPFMAFEPYFSTQNPNNSVHFAPAPRQHHQRFPSLRRMASRLTRAAA
ncbi:hypothetical protein PLICRDRAFT_48545 [Plicaturopsis crispa FD-325 SS-3]|nr:hypothetical protein PLICRDRAFT_48545 [Plicaturopsis crispa FD-325 SS-3]